MKTLLLVAVFAAFLTSTDGVAAESKYSTTSFKIEVNRFLNHHSEQYAGFELVFNNKAPRLVLIKKFENPGTADEEERIPIWNKSTDEIVQFLADKGFHKTLPASTETPSYDTPTPTPETTTDSTTTDDTTSSSTTTTESTTTTTTKGGESGSSGSSGQSKTFPSEKEL